MTDADRLLREIVARPADDALRLVFAGYMEDHGGNEAWAQFIQVQCELGNRDDERCGCRECRPNGQHNNGPCRSPLKELRRRERELWPAVRPVFDGYGWISCLEGSAFSKREAVSPSNAILIVRRGFPAIVRCTLAEWRGGECEWCHGNGRLGHPAPGQPGFIGYPECPTCHGTGRTPGIGPRLAQAWPVERVEVTDAVIHRSGGNDTYYVGGLGVFPKEFWRGLEGHRTIASARAALSAACLALARSQVI